METRLAKKEDLDDLKEIWRQCFGDPDNYIDLYFGTRDWTGETAVLTVDGRAVSMLAMIPVRMLFGSEGESLSASMIFAVATHPEHRRRGLADRLIEFANQHLLSMQRSATLLVPAEEELFRFYEKRGYRDGFSVREAVLSRDDIGRLTNPPADPGQSCLLVPAEPSEYNRIRRKLLTGRSYLDYRDEEVSFQKQVAVMFGTDIYAIGFCGENELKENSEAGSEGVVKDRPDSGERNVEGCAYAERISQDTVIVKELLVPERYLAAALEAVREMLPAEEYIIRTPAYAGEILGGTVRSFGMLRMNGADGRASDAEPGFNAPKSYLGIAYD